MLGMIPLAACVSVYVGVPRSRFANFGRKNETDLTSFWSRWLVSRMGLCLSCLLCKYCTIGMSAGAARCARDEGYP
jgi:hypothetical protein